MHPCYSRRTDPTLQIPGVQNLGACENVSAIQTENDEKKITENDAKKDKKITEIQVLTKYLTSEK